MFANHPQAAIDYNAIRTGELVCAATTHRRATKARRGEVRRVGTRRTDAVIARARALRQAGIGALRRARGPLPLDEAAPAVS